MTAAARRCVALLRGVNVGRARRVAMADLRALVESLGCADVRTLLNSGNVVFSPPRTGTSGMSDAIEHALRDRLGVASRVTVLSATELDEIVAENPFAGTAVEASRLLVAFCRDADGPRKLAPLLAEEWGTDALAVGQRAAYLWCASGILGSALPESVTRVLRDGVTTRNWATVLKLQALTKG